MSAIYDTSIRRVNEIADGKERERTRGKKHEIGIGVWK
jgi:hypothetical protein